MSMDIANAIAKVAPDVIAEIIEGSSAKIIDHARLPKEQSSPNYLMSALIGAVVGAILAVAVILIRHMMDTCIHNEEELEKICSVPVLGLIPDLTADAKAVGKKVRR
jgi:capsular polysaccharide biosynthesis protein